MADQNINITPIEGIGIDISTETYNIDIKDENIVIEKKVEENTILIQETPDIALELKKEPDSVLNLEGEVIKVSPSDHNMLYHRDFPDQHPIGAITGLEQALNTFIFEQEIASDTWVITHNLNKYPSFTVVDSAGQAQLPDEAKYDNSNQITIKFASSFAGKAFLN